MSQEKVDRYKEEKKNRQKIMKKERRTRRLEITVVVVILAALVTWFGIAVVRNSRANAEGSTVSPTVLDLSGFDEYQQMLNTRDAE